MTRCWPRSWSMGALVRKHWDALPRQWRTCASRVSPQTRNSWSASLAANNSEARSMTPHSYHTLTSSPASWRCAPSLPRSSPRMCHVWWSGCGGRPLWRNITCDAAGRSWMMQIPFACCTRTILRLFQSTCAAALCSFDNRFVAKASVLVRPPCVSRPNVLK